MAHIVYPPFQDPGKLYSYTLGLRYLMRDRPVFNSFDRDMKINDVRYGGTVTIPEQKGRRDDPEQTYDDSQHGLLDPLTWLEELAAGLNTSEFGIDEPTIQTDGSNFFATQGNPTLSDNLLRLSVTTTGDATKAIARRGMLVALGNNPARLYRINSIVNTVWMLSPGRLPWGTVGNPLPARTLRFELLDPNELAQYRDYAIRGPYRFRFIETRR